MTVRSRLILFAGLGLVLAFSAACGGGSGLSAEAYGTQMQELDDASEARQAELRETYEGATEDLQPDENLPAETVAAIRAYYEGLVEAGKDFVNAADDLDPPGDVADAHDAFVAAYDEVLVQFNDIIDRVGAALTGADLAALTSGQELSAALTGANTACASLQTAAVDAGRHAGSGMPFVNY